MSYFPGHYAVPYSPTQLVNTSSAYDLAFHFTVNRHAKEKHPYSLPFYILIFFHSTYKLERF